MFELLVELARGREVLQHSFGERFVPILVPPWNRIDPAIVARLRDAALRGVSTLGPRKSRQPATGLVQSNVHVDVIAWRDNRAFIGVEAAIDRTVAHLRARREGDADVDEATGLLTHHLDMTEAGWEFVVELVARTRAARATWVDVDTAFSDSDAATSGRST